MKQKKNNGLNVMGYELTEEQYLKLLDEAKKRASFWNSLKDEERRNFIKKNIL